MHAVSPVHVESYSHWPNGAPSAVLFIEESAIILHTYPERSYIELTLHSCKTIQDAEEVASTIIGDLGLTVRYYRYDAARNWRERASEPWDVENWPLEILAASFSDGSK